MIQVFCRIMTPDYFLENMLKIHSTLNLTIEPCHGSHNAMCDSWQYMAILFYAVMIAAIFGKLFHLILSSQSNYCSLLTSSMQKLAKYILGAQLMPFFAEYQY